MVVHDELQLIIKHILLLLNFLNDSWQAYQEPRQREIKREKQRKRNNETEIKREEQRKRNKERDLRERNKEREKRERNKERGKKREKQREKNKERETRNDNLGVRNKERQTDTLLKKKIIKSDYSGSLLILSLILLSFSNCD